MKIDLIDDPCCGGPAELEPLSNNAEDRLVMVFRALADRTRLEIFRFIAAQAEPICVCYVVDQFDVSQPTVSHHLRVLREAGVVRTHRQGTSIEYSLDPDVRGRLSAIAGGLVAG